MICKRLRTKFVMALFSLFLFVFNFISPKALFLVYAQTKNDLNSYFIRNLQDMAKIGSNSNVDILIQWEQPNKNGIWRYRVNAGSVDLLYHVAVPEKKDVVNDIVEFVRWGVGVCPRYDYVTLILSGHGSGFVDPSNFVPRGVLFDWESKNYLSNSQLISVLDRIKNSILGGKNLDLLGMDACLMASIEMNYQIRSKVNIFVASEEVQHADGWWYSEIFSEFKNKVLTPEELAKRIVSTCGRFYENRIAWYTQSAVKVSEMEALKNVFNQILVDLQSCKNSLGAPIISAVKTARKNCLQFNSPIYVDLHSFYFELYNQLKGKSLGRNIAYSSEEKLQAGDNSGLFMIDRSKVNLLEENYIPIVINDFSQKTTDASLDLTITKTSDVVISNSEGLIDLKDLLNRIDDQDLEFDFTETKSPQIEQLKLDLLLGMQMIERSVIANAAAKTFGRAKGISIYFPRNAYIEQTYVTTEFAKDTLWVQFLMEYMR